MDKENKPTILIDTNILISAVILKRDSAPNKLLTLWKQDRYNLVMSEELIMEIEAVLKREKIYKKYHISQQETQELITELRFSTIFIVPLSLALLPVHSRDIKDDKLLTCAIAGECDYLITGDQDLLVLNGNQSLGKIKILTAKEFLSL